MAMEVTHEEFEEHLLDREQFMIGGRDTAMVVWLALAILVTLFLITLGLAGDPPLPGTGSGISPGAAQTVALQSIPGLR